ncbi:MAG: FGGY family carbohydrate kinase [Cyclobacteriaceae bacterium]
MRSEALSYVIGIDAGTTSFKGVLLDNYGNLVTSSGKEYKLDAGPNDTFEVDPEVYWDITCWVIRDILRKSGIDPSVVSGIAFSCQGETFITVDSAGRPLRKAIVMIDNRSVKEAKLIKEKFGSQLIMEITGQPEVVPTWPATRILWIRHNEPFVFDKVAKYLLVEDYLIFKLTGQFSSDHSLSSSTLYFNITAKQWWDPMLAFLGISSRQLPELLPPGSKVQHLAREAALATGLTTNTMIVTGAYDHACGAIGAGNTSEGIVTLTIGGAMAMCVTLNKPVFDASLKLPCQCHAIPGLFFLLPYAQTAGLVLKWFKDEFCEEEIEAARRLDSSPYDLMIAKAAGVPPGSEGLIMLPHLMGTGSPFYNTKVKGVLAGITIGLKKGHFVRAILEAVACTIEDNLESMRRKGINVQEIHVLGGGSKNRLWNQIIADMTRIPVVTTSQAENASIGAAILAGVGVGMYKDIVSTSKALAEVTSRIEPEAGNYDRYREVYRTYSLLYKCLENYWILS